MKVRQNERGLADTSDTCADDGRHADRDGGYYCDVKEGVAMLSPLREAFCLAYAQCGNATQAYKQAGYKVKNDKSAGVAAARLLGNVSIQARLQEIHAKIESKKIMGPKEMQERLTAIARQTARDPSDKAPDYKDALKAMDQLARMSGSYAADKLEVSGELPVVLRDDIGIDGK